MVCVIGVMIPSAFGESEIYHEFKERWNWDGSTSQSGAEGAFDSPRSIAIDSKDFVYVVDSKHRIQKFSSEGELVSVWKNIGRSALEINSKDEVYVVDGTANAGYKVVKLSDDGQVIETWGPESSIGYDHKFDLLGKNNPAIFVDKSDNIYFSEKKYISQSPTVYEIKVLKYSPNGQLLKTFENMGMPSAQDDDGNLYAASSGIVDWSNSECHIIKYNSLGEYIDRFGDCGTRGWVDIEIDSNGVIYATSGVRGSIYKFSTDGEALGRIGSCCGIQEQHYGNPTGIALDSQNNVFVIDYARHSVFVYTPVEQKSEQSTFTEPMIDEEPMASSPTCGKGTVLKNGLCVAEQQTQQSQGGGCLIATAAFGSELAPQVQLLRELRDNTVLQTESGTSFMTGFNQFYYSFSPAIADYERENPAFKEAVKITLTPLLASLTLLQYADIDSESEMLGYGIGVILLNIGMYFVAPAVLLSVCIRKIHQKQG